LNKDAVIQQDEIFAVVFQDSANIIRLILPTNSFVRTNNLGFTQIINLTPKALWNDKKGVLKALCRFSTESAWQVQNKLLLGTASAWNPFVNVAIDDTSLVAATNTQRHTLYFNRNHRKWEISIGTNNNLQRSLLTTGYDIRGQKEIFSKFRWNVGQKMSFRTTLLQQEKISNAEFFPLRNYKIAVKSVEPELNFLPNRVFRYRINYRFSQNQNTIGEREYADIHDFGNEVTYAYKNKTTLRAKASFVSIAYIGVRNSPVQYVMLNALQAGKNYLWNLQLNQAINKTLQLEIRYDGRKTASSLRIIHTGNMAVRALF
jgi:hypothetical protein